MSEFHILSANVGAGADFGKYIFSKRGLDHLTPLLLFEMDLLCGAL
jgi:hypothetical protein